MLRFRLQADGENEVRIFGLKHQKEKRSMDPSVDENDAGRLEGFS